MVEVKRVMHALKPDVEITNTSIKLLADIQGLVLGDILIVPRGRIVGTPESKYE